MADPQDKRCISAHAAAALPLGLKSRCTAAIALTDARRGDATGRHEAGKHCALAPLLTAVPVPPVFACSCMIASCWDQKDRSSGT
jgi:hypothetical protein